MTPKEKAEHIYLKMLKWQQDADIYLKRNIISTASIKCALIAVDEIINSVDDEHVSDIFNDYWKEVKQELEKIDKL